MDWFNLTFLLIFDVFRQTQSAYIATECFCLMKPREQCDKHHSQTPVIILLFKSQTYMQEIQKCCYESESYIPSDHVIYNHMTGSQPSCIN